MWGKGKPFSLEDENFHGQEQMHGVASRMETMPLWIILVVIIIFAENSHFCSTEILKLVHVDESFLLSVLQKMGWVDMVVYFHGQILCFHE